MLRRVAPSALRMPISRVRSVTDTSMMFMMPMPPTSRLTAAMPASSVVNTCVVSPSVCEKVRLIANAEIVGLTLSQLMRPAHGRLNLGHRVGNVVLARREREDVVELLRLEDAIPTGAERNENVVVRTAEAGARALGLENADHRELHAADAHVLADQRVRILDLQAS